MTTPNPESSDPSSVEEVLPLRPALSTYPPQGLREAPADLEDRRRWERLLEGQSRILEEVTGNAHLPSVLEAICRLIEAFSPETICSVLLLQPDGRTLARGAAPSLPPAYWKAHDGMTIGPAAGSCGTAMHRAQQVIVTDIATDPLWESYRDLALSHGLRACWSTPILSSRAKVLGSFALYFRDPRPPGPDDLRLVDYASQLTGLAIERSQAHQALKSQRRWLDAALCGLGEGVVAADEQGRIGFMNPVAEKLTGWGLFEARGLPLGQVLHCPPGEGIHLLQMEGRYGHRVPIKLRRIALAPPGGQVLVFRDRSEEPRREGALRPRLREAGRELEELLARFDVRTELLARNPALPESSRRAAEEARGLGEQIRTLGRRLQELAEGEEV